MASSVSSVLESSTLPPPAKGGEVTGGASGRLSLRGVPCKVRGEVALLSSSCGYPMNAHLASPPGADRSEFKDKKKTSRTSSPRVKSQDSPKLFSP